MKKYIILVIIILLVLFLNFVQSNTLNKNANELQMYLKNIEIYILNNNYDAALDSLKNLENVWEKNKGKWDILTEHDDVEEISSNISSLRIYTENGEFIDILNEIAIIKQRIFHIIENEMPSFATIF